LKHTDDKAMVVEFKDFLLIAEAPGSTTNGELILREAKKIAPSKPVRYFVAGHHHADYMGGLRAFVSEGSQIICNNANREYIKYIANAPHTLNPDELQLHPKPLVLDTLVGNSKVITDGKLEMKIYWIGIKSQHTSDFMMYYFPAEKMLFEDDLTWIRKDGYQVKANVRQAALYNAIKELKLDVKTIIQSSPANSPNVLSVIPFEELEKTLVK
jgi:glyoxylase-like metal-dependent hydrolase (beta-lactamase superfamily II)